MITVAFMLIEGIENTRLDLVDLSGIDDFDRPCAFENIDGLDMILVLDFEINIGGADCLRDGEPQVVICNRKAGTDKTVRFDKIRGALYLVKCSVNQSRCPFVTLGCDYSLLSILRRRDSNRLSRSIQQRSCLVRS